MDNYTLLIIVNILLAINALFTLTLTGSVDRKTALNWRISALFLFAGAIFLILQGKISPFLSYIVSNHILLTGFFFQVETASRFKYPRRKWNKAFYFWLIILCDAFLLYLTYIRFNTSLRIVAFSMFTAVIFGYGAFEVHFKDKIKHQQNDKRLWGVYYLFIISGAFYFFRLFFTIEGLGRVSSLFDRNLLTTLTFLHIIVYSVSFTMSLLIYALKEKNRALEEKNKIIQKEKNQLYYLFNFLNDTAQYLDPLQLYVTIGKTLQHSLGVHNGAIYLIDNEKDEIHIAYEYHNTELPLDQVRVFSRGEGATGTAIEQDRVIEIDMDTYPNRSIADAYKTKGINKIVSAPIKSSDGILGAITLALSTEEDKGIFDREFFYHMGGLTGLVMRNASLFEESIINSHTDPLTGLMNRRKMTNLILEEINRSERKGHRFSLAIADLDNFKVVNDEYGHDCGDNVLVNVSGIFRDGCRETDFISRWGGEEFLFLFVETDIEEARQVSERIRQNIAGVPIACLSGKYISISIGLTEFKPQFTVEQMIKRADEALYKAKRNGKNRVEMSLG